MTEAYFDHIRIWLRSPLSVNEIDWLKAKCRVVKVRNKRARFGRGYTQRISLFQPSFEALQSLATIADARVTYAEMALDYGCHGEEEKEQIFRTFCHFLTKSHHRSQAVSFVGAVEKQTLYSGPRAAPNVIVIYRDRKASKKRGIKDALHIEWRCRTRKALRQAGICNVRDLLMFSHREFWRKRLRFRDVKLRELGRAHNTLGQGIARRTPWMIIRGSFYYDVDLRTGAIIMRLLKNRSIQELIDRWGTKLSAARFLITLENSHLLPP